MLINEAKADTANGRVKFVSYTGSYPTLCHGILTLAIDGEEVRFNDYDRSTYRPKEGTYPKFWRSGGECYFTGNYSAPVVTQGEWEIDVEALPEHLRELASEIDSAFNSNVRNGCCGGCI